MQIPSLELDSSTRAHGFQMNPNTVRKGFPAGQGQEDRGEPAALALQAPCIRSHGVLLLCSPSPPSFISPPNCE